MQTNSLSPIIERLDNLFLDLNRHFYNSELEKPVITVNPNEGRNALGWCTTWKVWGSSNEEVTLEDYDRGYYEINMSAEYLNRPFEEIVETMLHEMVHLYNLQQNVQDCSRGGTYHNRRFKAVAEQHGLVCDVFAPYGYAHTALNEQARDYILTIENDMDLGLYRRTRMVRPSSKGRKSASSKGKNDAARKTRKMTRYEYICPICGQTIQTAQEASLLCADCVVPMRAIHN